MKTHHVIVRQISATQYRVYSGGSLLINESSTPFRDSAQMLLADGAAVDDMLVCSIEGSVYETLRNRVGKLAGNSNNDR